MNEHDQGFSSIEKTRQEKPENTTPISRREVLRRALLTFLVGGILSSLPGEPGILQGGGESYLDRLRKKFEGSKMSEISTAFFDRISVIDYFAANVPDELIRQLTDASPTAVGAASGLQNREITSAMTDAKRNFHEIATDPFFQSIEIFQKSGLSQETLEHLKAPLYSFIKVLTDELMKIAGHHGRLVELGSVNALANTAQHQGLDAFFPEDPEDNKGEMARAFGRSRSEFALANGLRDFDLHLNQQGPWVLKFDTQFSIDPQPLINQIKKSGRRDQVINCAFQFGTVEAELALLRHQPPLYASIAYFDGRTTHLVISFYRLKNAENIPESKIFRSVAQPDNSVMLELDPSFQDQVEVLGSRALPVDNESNSIQENIEVALDQLSSSDQEYQTWLQDRPTTYIGPEETGRMMITEPYNSENKAKHFALYRQFCQQLGEHLIVHAGGNNSDLTGLNDFPENGLVVSSLGGDREFRHRKFGTPSRQNIGAIGAEIYVDAESIYPGESDIHPFSTSEATGIVSGYATLLRVLGTSPTETKQILLKFCESQVASIENPNSDQKQEIDIPVLNVKKLETFITTLIQKS